jgi:hypothetical protein
MSIFQNLLDEMSKEEFQEFLSEELVPQALELAENSDHVVAGWTDWEKDGRLSEQPRDKDDHFLITSRKYYPEIKDRIKQFLKDNDLPTDMMQLRKNKSVNLVYRPVKK